MFEELPLELNCQIIDHLNLLALFSFAKTNSKNRDWWHETLFTRSADDSNYQAQLHLLKHWSRNPSKLLQKNPIARDRLNNILKEYLKRNANRLDLSCQESVYTCLMMLSAFEKNRDQLKEYFIRLSFVSNFNVSLALSVLVRISLILRDDQSLSLFRYFLEGKSLANDYEEFVTKLLLYQVPIDQSELVKFKQKWLTELRNSSEHWVYHHHESDLESIHETLTSEEALAIIQSFLTKFFGSDSEKFLNYPSVKSRKARLEKFLSRLNSSDLNLVFNFLLDLLKEKDTEHLSKILPKIADVIKIFSIRFTPEQRDQCFTSLLDCFKCLYKQKKLNFKEVKHVLKELLERSDSTSFLRNLESLVDFLCLSLNEEQLKTLDSKLGKEHDQTLKKLDDSKILYRLMEDEKTCSSTKKEFMLFCKLKLYEYQEEFDATLIKMVCNKLSTVSCRFLISRFFLLDLKNNVFSGMHYETVAAILGRKDMSLFLKSIELLVKSSKNNMQRILNAMLKQGLSLDNICFSSEKANLYFEELINGNMDDEKIQSELLLHLGKYINKDLSYIYLKKIVSEDYFSDKKYVVKSLTTSITTKQAEDLLLAILEKFQSKIPLIKENIFAEMLGKLVIKLPKDKIKNTYLPKLLVMQDRIDIAKILIAKLSTLLSDELINKLINQFLIEIKKGDEDLPGLLSKNVSQWFTEMQVADYYQYLMTCRKSADDIILYHSDLVTALINKFTGEQLIALFGLYKLDKNLTNVFQPTSSYCFKSTIKNALSHIEAKNLAPLYLKLQEQVKRMGAPEGDILWFNKDDQIFVD